jgi:hypothetical protein
MQRSNHAPFIGHEKQTRCSKLQEYKDGPHDYSGRQNKANNIKVGVKIIKVGTVYHASDAMKFLASVFTVRELYLILKTYHLNEVHY